MDLWNCVQLQAREVGGRGGRNTQAGKRGFRNEQVTTSCSVTETTNLKPASEGSCDGKRSSRTLVQSMNAPPFPLLQNVLRVPRFSHGLPLFLRSDCLSESPYHVLQAHITATGHSRPPGYGPRRYIVTFFQRNLVSLASYLAIACPARPFICSLSLSMASVQVHLLSKLNLCLACRLEGFLTNQILCSRRAYWQGALPACFGPLFWVQCFPS